MKVTPIEEEDSAAANRVSRGEGSEDRRGLIKTGAARASPPSDIQRECARSGDSDRAGGPRSTSPQSGHQRDPLTFLFGIVPSVFASFRSAEQVELPREVQKPHAPPSSPTIGQFHAHGAWSLYEDWLASQIYTYLHFRK
ncbi:hypothetical protein P4O66_004618 [Electrophorus voltai]|uniref:Uncharacterized protein n=1 Tax=Electrophorus voltai TaxID=2609070 RepID=A0AAD8ZNX7_9TELE|nr:hypothetical protein P4O66_004618 [Electrophorus voltai]